MLLLLTIAAAEAARQPNPQFSIRSFGKDELHVEAKYTFPAVPTWESYSGGRLMDSDRGRVAFLKVIVGARSKVVMHVTRQYGDVWRLESAEFVYGRDGELRRVERR